MAWVSTCLFQGNPSLFWGDQPSSDNHRKLPWHVLCSKISSPCCCWIIPSPGVRDNPRCCNMRKWDGTRPAFPVATGTSLHTYHGCTGFLSSRKNQPTSHLLSARGTLTKNDLGSTCYGFFESFRHAGPAMTFCFWRVVSRCLLGPQSTVFLHLWHTCYFPQDYVSLSFCQQSTQTNIYQFTVLEGVTYSLKEKFPSGQHKCCYPGFLCDYIERQKYFTSQTPSLGKPIEARWRKVSTCVIVIISILFVIYWKKKVLYFIEF